MQLFQAWRGFAVQVAEVEVAANVGLDMARADFAAAHADRHPESAVGADFFLQQRRIDAVLHRHQQAVGSEMGQHGVQSVGRIVGSHGDKAGVELAANLIKLVGISDLDLDIERAVGDVDMQAFLANRADMFFVDVDESDIRAGAGQPAADDAANGAGADDDHALHIGSSSELDYWIRLLKSNKYAKRRHRSMSQKRLTTAFQ